MTERPERRRIRPDEDPAIVQRLQERSDTQITRNRLRLLRANARMLERLAMQVRITSETNADLHSTQEVIA
jgi:hypothetical protein